MTALEVPIELLVPLIFGGVLYLLWFIGVFTSIRFQPSTIDPMTFVYKTKKGPYPEVGPAFSITIDFMKKQGFDTSKLPTAGMYYDDPETTKDPRYAVGFVLNDAASKKKWEKIQQENKEEAKEWSTLELKKTPTIVSIFPMRWVVASCAISAMKTYPAFKSSSYEMNSGSMEIYRTDNKTVETHFPQGNYEQFCPQESDSFPSSNDKKKVQ